MNMWHAANDDIREIERQTGEMTVDQRLKLAQIKALLSISQELSAIGARRAGSANDYHRVP